MYVRNYEVSIEQRDYRPDYSGEVRRPSAYGGYRVRLDLEMDDYEFQRFLALMRGEWGVEPTDMPKRRPELPGRPELPQPDAPKELRGYEVVEAEFIDDD